MIIAFFAPCPLWPYFVLLLKYQLHFKHCMLTYFLKIHHILQVFIVLHQSAGWLGSPSAGVPRAHPRGCICLAMSGDCAKPRRLGCLSRSLHGIACWAFSHCAPADPEQCYKKVKAEVMRTYFNILNKLQIPV